MRINSLFALSVLTLANPSPGQGQAWEPEGHEHVASSSNQIDIHCQPVNDFGYIASAEGSLRATSLQAGGFFVSGSLHVNTKPFGEHDNERSIFVQGNLDVHGSLLLADVLSGAPDLDSVAFVFSQSSASNIAAFNSTQYQTQC